jgi:hypothetical protein
VPVATGDLVGFTDLTPNTSNPALHCGDGGGAAIFNPPLASGDELAPDAGSACELLVEAIAEPDADGDLFGDDSQDYCPGAAGPKEAEEEAQEVKEEGAAASGLISLAGATRRGRRERG